MPVPASSPLKTSLKTPLLADVENTLAFTDIARIDFIRPGQALIFGNDFGGGVIMITTKDGDEVGIARQFELKDFVPLGYQKYKEFASPILSSKIGMNDLQTTPTLLWLPSVKFDDNGKEINLKSPISSDYRVVIEGISDDSAIYETIEF